MGKECAMLTSWLMETKSVWHGAFEHTGNEVFYSMFATVFRPKLNGSQSEPKAHLWLRTGMVTLEVSFSVNVFLQRSDDVGFCFCRVAGCRTQAAGQLSSRQLRRKSFWWERAPYMLDGQLTFLDYTRMTRTNREV